MRATASMRTKAASRAPVSAFSAGCAVAMKIQKATPPTSARSPSVRRSQPMWPSALMLSVRAVDGATREILIVAITAESKAMPMVIAEATRKGHGENDTTSPRGAS